MYVTSHTLIQPVSNRCQPKSYICIPLFSLSQALVIIIMHISSLMTRVYLRTDNITCFFISNCSHILLSNNYKIHRYQQILVEFCVKLLTLRFQMLIVHEYASSMEEGTYVFFPAWKCSSICISRSRVLKITPFFPL